MSASDLLPETYNAPPELEIIRLYQPGQTNADHCSSGAVKQESTCPKQGGGGASSWRPEEVGSSHYKSSLNSFHEQLSTLPDCTSITTLPCNSNAHDDATSAVTCGGSSS